MNRRKTVLTNPDLYGDGVRAVVHASCLGDPVDGSWRVATTIEVDQKDPAVRVAPDLSETNTDDSAWIQASVISRTGLWRAEQAHAEYDYWVDRFENASWGVVERRDWSERSRYDDDRAVDEAAEDEIRRTAAPEVWQDQRRASITPGMILRDTHNQRWVSVCVERGRAPHITEQGPDGVRIAVALIADNGDADPGTPLRNPSQADSELTVDGYASGDLVDSAQVMVDASPAWTSMVDPREARPRARITSNDTGDDDDE